MKKFLKRLRIAGRVLSGKTGTMTITATLIHEDGSTEDLGVLSEGQVDMTPKAG